MNEFENNSNNYGNQSNNTNNFGNPYNFGNQPSDSNGYGAQQSNPYSYGAQSNDANSYGAQQNNPYSYGAQSNDANGYGAQQNNPYSYGAQSNDANGYGAQQSNPYTYGTQSNDANDYGQTQPLYSQDSTSSTQNTPANTGSSDGYSAPSQTYSSTYTPGESGYTRSTDYGSSYSPYCAQNNSSSSYNSASSDPTSIYSSLYTSDSAVSYKQKKKKSAKKGSGKAVFAIIGVVVALAVLAGGAFVIWKFVNPFDNTNGNASVSDTSAETVPGGNAIDGDSTPESDDQSTVTKDSETENTPADTAEQQGTSISKNPGSSIETANGKIGELMTKAQVAALVKDSVVEITTEQVVNGNSFWQYVQSGAGSGVIIAAEGYIITNNHVIEGANKIVVRLTNGNEYEAELIGTDASSDIAVLKIKPAEKLTVATLGASSTLSLAEEILVIGNPLGELGGTITNGIVSALAREITIEGEKMTLIQTNAAVNPGNSGGGMFNLYGELVGIVNAKSSGEDVEGLGFAIPIDTAYNIVEQLMDYGYVRGRVDHGLDLIDITDLFTAASYRVSTLGVYVYESKYTDEIQNGDRIASINGKEVSTSAEVKEALYDCKVGDTVKVTVVRKSRLIDVELTLREYIPEDSTNVSFE